jgi:hypothetical protein
VTQPQQRGGPFEERKTMNKRQKSFKPGQGYTKEDWDAVAYNPEWTAEDFARAKPFAEVFPELAASMRQDRSPDKAPTKKLVRTNKVK